MTNLINSHGDNVFYNYRTPLVMGETGALSTTSLRSFIEAKLPGGEGITWSLSGTSGDTLFARLPAPGLEMKTTNVTSLTSPGRRIEMTAAFFGARVNTSNNPTTGHSIVGSTVSSLSNDGNNILFAVINDYAVCWAAFSNSTLSTLRAFAYCGWLREPQFTGTSVSPRGLCSIRVQSSVTAVRPTAENTTSATTLSTADNAITNPPITCNIATSGADATDIVIRDGAAPNNAIGKLYNCVSLPNEAVVGQIWKNTGVDPETGLAHTSGNTDKYLVVCPWGGRKLGMRIWTEGYT